MVDYSGCIEASAGYFGYARTLSGKIVVSSDATGGASERIYGKDPTGATDITKGTFWLQKFQISCSSGKVSLIDGSAGTKILGSQGWDAIGPVSTYFEWDFKNDPIACLTAETTQSLCISAENAWWRIQLQGFWGFK